MRRTHRLGALALATLAVAALTDLGSAGAALPTPAVPSGLPSDIERLQPYVPQRVCDPVAKPGVLAFRATVLATYPGTGDYGITRDCSVGDISEHKEGRAWDWAVNSADPGQKAIADNLIAWLLAPDAAGHQAAMARRLGIMYIIWNQQVLGTYLLDEGWRPYTGPNPHTDHVHFSFSWAGARQVTSYWTGVVAGIDFGPNLAQPALSNANVAIIGQYGTQRLEYGDTGPGVTALQQGLRVGADGMFGYGTKAALQSFEVATGRTPDGVVGQTDWRNLYPVPVEPFGSLDGLSADPATVNNAGGQSVRVTGWAIDADTRGRVLVRVIVDGVQQSTTRTTASRPDVEAAYSWGADVGYDVTLSRLAPGTHTVCVTADNRGMSTTGGAKNVTIGCGTVVNDPAAPAPAPAPVAVPAPQPVAVVAAAPVAAATPVPYPGRALRRGSSGPSVVLLQQKLGVGADGKFGPLTAAAVRGFQSSHGLAADAVVGPATWGALFG